MKIYATCQCCTKKNIIVDNYTMGNSFNKKTEFGFRLLNSLKQHLESIEQKCLEQGHYDKIWIELDGFDSDKEVSKLLPEILKEYLLIKKKEENEQDKSGFTLKEWLEQEKITPEDYKKLNILFKEEEDKTFAWEEIQKGLMGGEKPETIPLPFSLPSSPSIKSIKTPPHSFPKPLDEPIAKPKPLDEPKNPKSPCSQTNWETKR